VETTLSRRRAHGVPLTARPQLSTVEPTAKQDFLLQSELARGHLQIESVDGLEAQRAKPQRTSVRFRHLGRGRLGMCVAQSALPVSPSLPAVHLVTACEGREVVLLLLLGHVLWLTLGQTDAPAVVRCWKSQVRFAQSQAPLLRFPLEACSASHKSDWHCVHCRSS